ncbi:MAG: transposase, partial [Defluviitaleaceae bacterium]|nr:transposase [Defluviitaleaceae bacterium]
SFHRKSTLKELAAKANCEVIFLPPYSPDLNPIEKFWAWLKQKLKSVLFMFPNFDDALMDCF